jgi:hypothetical protein
VTKGCSDNNDVTMGQNMTESAVEAAQAIVASAEAQDTIGKAKWFAITHRGAIAFRFGPFTGPEIGAIMTRCAQEKIPLLVTADCGTPFDWELAADLHGDEQHGDGAGG